MSKKMNEKESGVKEVQVEHPLMEFVPIIFNSFEEWLARWNGTTYLAEKMGLLHSLTTGNGWWPKPELVSFLLSIADGCANESFVIDEGYYQQSTKAQNRKSIANKAFSVLCLKFFRNERNREPLWWWMLEYEDLFQKVLWFLRPRAGGFNRLYNCGCISQSSSDHQQGIFRNFLKELSWLGWEFLYLGSRRRWNEETVNLVEKRLITARPQFIDVLRELGKLHLLNSREIELDARSVKRLTEMALSDSLFLPPEKVSDGYNSLREPKDLEEAVLGGSIAAQIVLLHQIKECKRKHINGLYEAAVSQREAQQKVEELEDIEKKRRDLEERARNLTVS